MKYLHILSNVKYGGGEAVLLQLCSVLPRVHNLYLLRNSQKFPCIPSVFNGSPLKAHDAYAIFPGQILTFFYLNYLLFKIRIFYSGNFQIIFHGFPCQFSLPVARILFPKKKLVMVYHQIKRPQKSLLGRLVNYIESLSIISSSPVLLGAPSSQSLSSVICSLPLLGSYKLRHKISSFIFKNSFPAPATNFCLSKSEHYSLLSSSSQAFILVVGRFDKRKGQARLLKYISNNWTVLSKYRFYFAGDGLELEFCKDYAFHNEITNAYFLGAVHPRDIGHFYSKCVCTFQPSHGESYGVTIFEAASFKKTVLVFEESLATAPFVKYINPAFRVSDYLLNEYFRFPDIKLSDYIHTVHDTSDCIASLFES